MKCQRCGENPATTAYVQIVDDNKETLNLCGACLQGIKGGDSEGAAAAPVPAPEPEPEPLELTGDAPADCPECGMSYAEFRKEARFGCGACYTAFAPKLERLFRRIHGADGHTGKGGEAPASVASGEDLEQLKESLQVAVAAEDYEEAAQLRDQIRRLEGQG